MCPPGSISTIFGDFLKNPFFDLSQGPYIGQKMVIFDQKWPFLAKNIYFCLKIGNFVIFLAINSPKSSGIILMDVLEEFYG